MWPHSLLGMPLFALGLCYVLPFEYALLLYLVLVLGAFALYYRITEKRGSSL